MSKGIAMAFDEYLKTKYEKNWQCVEMLREHQPRHFDVAASRLYYAIFLLIKSNMVANGKDERKPESSKMSADASTKAHKLALQYITDLNKMEGKQLRDLRDLRNIADYEPKPVTREEFERNFKTWDKWRKAFLATHRSA